MEVLLGERSRFVLCTKITTLTDELCKPENFEGVSVLIISCLSGIIWSLLGKQDAQESIEQTMESLGAGIGDLLRLNPELRVYVAQPTPRVGEEFVASKKFAMV